MKKFLSIIVLGLLLSRNAYADNVVTYKCNLDRENYEYTINCYQYKFNDISLKNMNTNKLFFEDRFKRSVDIMVIKGNMSYNFKGFKNKQSDLEHYLVFLGGSNFLYTYISVSNFDAGKASEFEIISFNNALDKVTKSICKKYK